MPPFANKQTAVVFLITAVLHVIAHHFPPSIFPTKPIQNIAHDYPLKRAIQNIAHDYPLKRSIENI